MNLQPLPFPDCHSALLRGIHPVEPSRAGRSIDLKLVGIDSTVGRRSSGSHHFSVSSLWYEIYVSDSEVCLFASALLSLKYRPGKKRMASVQCICFCERVVGCASMYFFREVCTLVFRLHGEGSVALAVSDKPRVPLFCRNPALSQQLMLQDELLDPGRTFPDFIAVSAILSCTQPPSLQTQSTFADSGSGIALSMFRFVHDRCYFPKTCEDNA